MAAKKPQADNKTFEAAYKRLQAIVEQLEQGDVPLDDAMALYEEGIGLSKICAGKLQGAELTLKRLQKDLEGTFSLLDEDIPEE
jgi:exodeoxyribonuclease VII small subunit